MSFLSRLFGAAPPGDSETAVLLEEVKTLRERSTCFKPGEEYDLAFTVMNDSATSEDAVLGARIGVPVYRLLKQLAESEPFSLVPRHSSHERDETL